ncbi:MAG: type II toxin-antitoxin system HicB family antitoxin [Cyanobacteria bacterium P01_G01_bin.19]
MDRNYSIIIQWSQKDNCFVASLPEWNNQNTHGESYEHALDNAQQVLSSLIESVASQGQPLPEASTFNVSSTVSSVVQ